MRTTRQRKAEQKPVRLRLTDGRLLGLVIGINLILAILVFDPKLSVGGDNAQYVILAKSILQGKYADLHEPGTPPHSQFPPVFPLMLVPLVALFGSSVIPLKVLVLVCGMGALAAFYLVLKRIVPGRGWLPPLLLLGFAPLYLQYTHYVFSELPFVLWSVLAIYFLLRSETDDRRRLLFAALAGLFAVLAFLTRSLGITLGLSMVVYLLIHRRWRELGAFALVFALVWLPWFIRDRGVPHTGGYLEQLLRKDMYNLDLGYVRVPDFLKRIRDNFSAYILRIYPVMLVPMLESASRSLLGVLGFLLTALTVTGWISRLRHGVFGVLGIYVFFAVGLLMIWPAYWAGDRFLLPLLPLLAIYLYLGLRWVGERIKFTPLAAIAVIVLVFGFGVTNARQAGTTLRDMNDYRRGDQFAGYDDSWRAYFEAGVWLRGHVEPGSIVVSRKPQFTWLMSGCQSFVYPYVGDEQQVLAAIDRQGATHAFFETFFAQSRDYLLPVIRNHPERFEQIGAVGPGNTKVIIFRVKR